MTQAEQHDRQSQLEVLRGPFWAVDAGLDVIAERLVAIRALPEVLADEAPDAYARRVLPLVADIRREADWLARIVADSQLVLHKGRGRRTNALTQQEIADGLGVARSTVARWSRSGPLPAGPEGEFGPTTIPDGRKQPEDSGD